MIVAGLNPNGFDRNTWVAGGKQGIFEEDNFSSPAYVARLDYKGVPGLRHSTIVPMRAPIQTNLIVIQVKSR